MPDPTTFFDRLAGLRREGRPFAVATVVARRAPVSAQLGDRAIVFGDGRMEGFVGGACSREIVRRQALDVIRRRHARLVSIRPDAAEESSVDADRVIVPMTCASEGAVDVYVEPVVAPRTIVVAGATPVAEAVARLARAMRYDVVRVVESAERADVEPEAVASGAALATLDELGTVLGRIAAAGGECGAVVATQGHYDEPALEVVLRSDLRYVGLVASRKRGGGVREWLAGQHVPGLDRLRIPAGLDLGGRTPEEVAVSILGEIVQAANRPSADATASATPSTETRATIAAPPPVAGAAIAVDPVCRMEVPTAGAQHTADVGGTIYYFCCGGCRTRFVANPRRYLASQP